MASKQEYCPDPSAHDHSGPRLQDQASKAALYVTHPEKNTEKPKSGIDALGPDGRLSSAGAAASLKYAQPHDLPSFPSVGIDTTSSGNTAANLANANQKPFEHWKPDGLSSSASKAALLANKKGDFADTLWQPDASKNGLSAAGIAMKGNHTVTLDYGYTDEGTRRALQAATLSINKKPAPAPEGPTYPDARNSAANALNAAKVAHKPLMSDPLEGRMSDDANEMSRITHQQNFNRDMFTEHPNFNIESDEQKRANALRAAQLSNKAAVDEAQRQLLEAQAAQAAMHGDIRNQAKNYLHLQSEAQRLANERLAKLDPDGAAVFREHYGFGDAPPTSKYRLSMRSRRDDPVDEEDDAARAGRIRHQTKNLNEQFQSLEDKKKQDDRAALQAVAEKLVKARMAQMDDRVFNETGKASPAMMEEWERQARIKANANVEERMKYYGKVNVGGGKYMEQSEIDAIAAGRMQPTLDEITATAEKQRARDEEIRLDQERRKQEKLVEQAREKEKKDAIKRQKGMWTLPLFHSVSAFTNTLAEEDKAARQAEKNAEKARKAEEKEQAATQKRLQKEEEKQLKEQRNKQDKAWAEEQQRVEEREAKEKAATDAATADVAESSGPVIKDMTTGEPKDVSTTQNQASIAPLAVGSKNYHGHDGPDTSRDVTSADDAKNDGHDDSSHARAVAAAVVAAPIAAESHGTDTVTVAKDDVSPISDAAGEKVDQDPEESEEAKITSVVSPATDAAHAEDSVQDPPGVPTSFPNGEQPKELVKSDRVPTNDAGAEVSQSHSPSTPRSEKRKSGLKGMLSKFRRSSRSDGEPGVISTTSTRASTGDKGKAKAPADTTAVAPAAAAAAADDGDDDTIIAPKPSLKERLSSAISRDTHTDDDDFQEARDQFDEPAAAKEVLAVPAAEGKAPHSPAPGSKFAEDL